MHVLSKIKLWYHASVNLYIVRMSKQTFDQRNVFLFVIFIKIFPIKYLDFRKSTYFLCTGLKYILAYANKTGHQTQNGLRNENKAP